MRILQVFAEPFANGGQESFIMNMYNNIDKSKFQFDFFTPYSCDNTKMAKKIKENGGNLYVCNKEFNCKKRKKYFVNELKKFLKANKYKNVHIHSGSIFALLNGARIAKKSGANQIIVHSHCTGIDSYKYRLIKKYSEKIFLRNVTDYLACSELAAEWKFPKKIVDKHNYTVIRNGIEVEKFVFNEDIRNEYRKMLNIKENEFVIGNIGRFEKQKNHSFLIEVFEKMLQIEGNCKLLLVGNGVEKEKIISIIKEKNIDNKVIMLENRSDCNRILQAMDVFVFPSLFEGLGIVAIEAQAAGLKTFCSENVPQEINLTNLYERIELSEGVDYWAKYILNKKNYTRQNLFNQIKQKGYDAIDSVKLLEYIYERRKSE